MGEMAEMMLDGTLCEACGAYIEGDAPGIPRYCSNQCAKDRGALHAMPHPKTVQLNATKTNCPVCNKRIKKTGVSDHLRDAHQTTPENILAARAGPDLLEALIAQVVVSKRLAAQAGFSDRDVADFTSQARRAIALATGKEF